MRRERKRKRDLQGGKETVVDIQLVGEENETVDTDWIEGFQRGKDLVVERVWKWGSMKVREALWELHWQTF